jgi:hypothetical protein
MRQGHESPKWELLEHMLRAFIGQPYGLRRLAEARGWINEFGYPDDLTPTEWLVILFPKAPPEVLKWARQQLHAGTWEEELLALLKAEAWTWVSSVEELSDLLGQRGKIRSVNQQPVKALARIDEIVQAPSIPLDPSTDHIRVGFDIRIETWLEVARKQISSRHRPVSLWRLGAIKGMVDIRINGICPTWEWRLWLRAMACWLYGPLLKERWQRPVELQVAIFVCVFSLSALMAFLYTLQLDGFDRGTQMQLASKLMLILSTPAMIGFAWEEMRVRLMVDRTVRTV